jgi:hypothetical protein
MSTDERVPLEVTVAALSTNPNLKVIQRWRGLSVELMLRVARTDGARAKAPALPGVA